MKCDDCPLLGTSACEVCTITVPGDIARPADQLPDSDYYGD